MLKEIIERNHYTFEEGFDNWEDAIRAGYKPLLADNTVEDIYVQAVIDCVKKLYQTSPCLILRKGQRDVMVQRSHS